MSPQDLASAYLKHYRSGDADDFWAFEDVINACGNLRDGFPVAMALISQAQDDLELAYVAAGPVEDLLKWHGVPALALFEKAAENSGKVRRALANVWIKDTDEAYSGWLALMELYGFQSQES